MDTRNKVFVVVGTVAVLATSGIIGVALFTKNDDTSSNTATASQTTSTTSSNSSSSSNANSNSSGESNSSNGSSSNSSSTSTSGSYKDGTYTATVSYSVPRTQNSLKATVVVSGGNITSVTTNNSYSDHESAEYVQGFESAVSSSASGKSLSSYSPTRIGGASLTTAAFAEALDEIRTQAQS